jgi:RNA polymerase sigma-70 factor (ECF subfamily)
MANAPDTAPRSVEAEEYAALTRPLFRRLYQAALALCGNPELAADLTQEALVRGFESFTTFRDGAPAYPWLARILRNIFLDHVRSARVRREVPLAGQPEPSWTGDPLSEVLAAERTRLVVSAISKLPPEFALVVTLVDLQGLTYAEVAAISEVPIGTVRSRLARGRARLRDLLAGVEAGPRASASRRWPRRSGASWRR